MQWTADTTKALGLTKERGDKKALKSLKKKQVNKVKIVVIIIIIIIIISVCLIRALSYRDMRKSLTSNNIDIE